MSSRNKLLELALGQDEQVHTSTLLRATSGDRLYLRVTQPLDIPLTVKCIGPVGEEVSPCVDVGLSYYPLGNAGPYRFSYLDHVAERVVERVVLVDPVMKGEEVVLSLDRIALQSHLTKCCGAVSFTKVALKSQLAFTSTFPKLL